MTRPSTDRVAVRGGGHILWRGDEIQFRIETRDNSLGGAFEFLAWNRTNKTARPLGKQRDLHSMSVPTGPRGGQLATKGVGGGGDMMWTQEACRPQRIGRDGVDIGA